MRARPPAIQRAHRLLPLVGLFLSACSMQWPVKQSAPEPMATNTYKCLDGYAFTAHVMKEEALVFTPEKTYSLPRVKAASGARYREGAVTFWSRDDEARLVSGDQTHAGCRVYRPDPRWENARGRGIDFRAVGNQPQWELELTLSDRTVLITDLGLTRYEFRTPEPSVNRETRRTRYNMRSNRHALVLVLKSAPCEHSLGGEQFPITVTATLDGTKYEGCGRALK